MKCRRAVLLVVITMVLVGCKGRNSAEDHYREGCQLEQQGRKGDALKAYRLAQEEGGTSQWAVEATLAMGNLQLLAGNRDDALTAFRYAFDLSQISRDTLRMVYALRDMSRCLRSSEWIASAANCFIKADGLAQAAHLDEARADLWPEWVDVALQQGDKEQVNQLLEEIDSLERSAELGASSASAKSEEDGLGAMWLARGRALLWLGREAEAEEALLRASESANVKTQQIRVGLAECYGVCGDDGQCEPSDRAREWRLGVVVGRPDWCGARERTVTAASLGSSFARPAVDSWRGRLLPLANTTPSGTGGYAE